MPKTREIHLQSRPKGLPDRRNFALIERELPEPAKGEFKVKNLYMTVDPYMRGRMEERESYIPPFNLNSVLQGDAVGQIVKSNHPHYAEGDYVLSFNGWREEFIASGNDNLRKLDPSACPLSAYLGVMGMPGLTAYAGLLKVAELKEGETVFVSSAAGAVGNLVGQIAKQKSCRVIGSTGSGEKVNYLTKECHFDYAFNYKEVDLRYALKTGAPNGIDVYFDNVGGSHLEAAIDNMRRYGRITCCGSIANYNAIEQSPGLRNYWEITARELTLRGFIVTSHTELQTRFRRDVGQWLKEGKIKYRETIYQGLEQSVEAFLGLFDGKNIGKMIVKL